MRCGKSSCNLLIILKKSYLLKNFVHYIKKMLNFHSLYSDCVWYKKLRELAFVHYIANFTISRFVITKFGCILNMPLFKTLVKVPALGTLEGYNAKFKRNNIGIKNVFIQKRPNYQQEWQ